MIICCPTGLFVFWFYRFWLGSFVCVVWQCNCLVFVNMLLYLSPCGNHILLIVDSFRHEMVRWVPHGFSCTLKILPYWTIPTLSPFLLYLPPPLPVGQVARMHLGIWSMGGPDYPQHPPHHCTCFWFPSSNILCLVCFTSHYFGWFMVCTKTLFINV